MSCSETVQQRPKYQSNLNKTPFNGYEAWYDEYTKQVVQWRHRRQFLALFRGQGSHRVGHVGCRNRENHSHEGLRS